jgi:histidyl-tRNA synthetase
VKPAVVPRLYKGLRDFLPDQMAARHRLIETIRGVYERYGFVPLGTPAIEHLDVLSGSAGQEAQDSIFRVQNLKDRGEDESALGLRFDLTVPLARVVSQYRDLPRPFRRYQVAPVWRADKPDRGRFREFIQFDIDSVGVESDVADVEIIAALCDTLEALDAGPYRVRFSSRRILNLVLQFASVPAELEVRILRQRGTPHERTDVERRPGTDVFRVLDKLDKIGAEKVRLEMGPGYRDDSGDWIPGLGLQPSQIDRIESFLAIRGDRRDDVLRQLSELFRDLPNARPEIEVLERISRRLEMLGYDDDRAIIDLSVARGLAYYTGPVFEALLLDAPQFGSVVGGGRYDDLVSRFLGESVPAVGASIGVDRLLAALVELGRINLKKSTADVLVVVVEPAVMDDCLSMTFELRRAGIPTEMYLGSRGIGKQIGYADALQIPIAVVFGGDEKAKGVITLKDMARGKLVSDQLTARADWLRERPGEVKVPRNQLVEAVQHLLARRED